MIINRKLLKRYVDKMVKDVEKTAIDEAGGYTEGHEIDLDRAKECMDKRCNRLLKKIKNGVLPERERDTYDVLVKIVERAYQKLGAEDGYGWIRNNSKPLVGVGSVEKQLHKAYKRQIAILRKKGINVDTITEQDLASIEADRIKKLKENEPGPLFVKTIILKKYIDKMTDDIVDTANQYYGTSMDLSAVKECMDKGCERLNKQLKKSAFTRVEVKATVKAMEEINKKAFRKIYEEDAFGHYSGEKSEADVNDVLNRIEKEYENYAEHVEMIKNANFTTDFLKRFNEALDKKYKSSDKKYKSSDLYVLPSDTKRGTIVLDSAIKKESTIKTELMKQVEEVMKMVEEDEDMER